MGKAGSFSVRPQPRARWVPLPREPGVAPAPKVSGKLHSALVRGHLFVFRRIMVFFSFLWSFQLSGFFTATPGSPS